MGEVCSLEQLKEIRASLKDEGKIVVFTNGVFDILHRGHCEYLQAAKEVGHVLVVGLNSDASVKRIKGDKKPIVPQEDRAAVLASLSSVDYVVYFDDDTPLELIAGLLPDVLIKGADYSVEEIVGATEVLDSGGNVRTIPLTPDRSSTNIVQTIIDRYCPDNT